MKKLCFLFLILLFPTLCLGECKTKVETLVYTDPDRLIFVDRVGSMYPKQGISLITEDIIAGKAFFIPPNTKVTSVKYINEYLCVAIINDTPLIAIKKHISCEE